MDYYDWVKASMQLGAMMWGARDHDTEYLMPNFIGASITTREWFAAFGVRVFEPRDVLD